MPETAPATGKPKVKKPRLGRGLSSLIKNSAQAPAAAGRYRPVAAQQAAEMPPAGQAIQVPLDRIDPNPYQPRREFKADELAELTDSIRRQGILQPLIVAPGEPREAGRYVLIAGGRRLRAAQQAALTTVPCVIREATPQQMLEWALIENIQRSDLNPVERAQAYRDYMDRFRLTQADAAERLSQPRATVANYLRILDLPDAVQKMLIDGSLTFGHAKVLAGLAGQQAKQLAIARKAAADSLSVRQLEQLVSAGASEQRPARDSRPAKAAPAYILDIEQQLTSALSTRVRITPGRAKNTGKIIIHYQGIEDFDRVVDALGVTLEG